MPASELAATTAWFLAIAFAAVGFGCFLLSQLGRFRPDTPPGVPPVPPAEQLGLGLMLGLGALGWLSMWIALAGFFRRPILLLVLAIVAVISLKSIRSEIETLVRWFAAWRRTRDFDPVSLALLLAAAFVFVTLYLTALLPPYASDELHYHFPQARLIVSSGRLEMPLGGHPFYGNIPKLMEVIFAFGIAIGGYSLAHTLHLAFVLGFALFVAGFLTRHYNLRTGCLAIVGILLYREYTWNATVGFVDAATSSLEIASLMLFVDWAASGRGRSLTTSAALLGLAVGMKYSPLPTALFIVVGGILILVVQGRSIRRPALAFAGIATLFGGFWYFRNLLLFGNPVYPFYFGHPGISDEAFASLLSALHEFGARSLGNFASTPSRFLDAGEPIVALALLLAPFSLAVDRRRWIHVPLALFAGLYSVYWFLIATHQTRFLAPAVLVCLILSAILVARYPWILLASLAVLIALLRHLDAPERVSYAFGDVTRSAFLQGQFGCQYAVIEHLDEKQLEGGVIDNWSVWHAPSLSFYATRNEFRRFTFPVAERGAEALAAELQRGKLQYVYLDTVVKARHLANADPEIARGRAERAAAEAEILRQSEQIFARETCQLYRINAVTP